MSTRRLEELIDRAELRKEVSAYELVEMFLNRIEELQPVINAFITVTAERALAQARRVDRAKAAGEKLPLSGMPIALKDNIDVAGVRTTVASRFFVDHVATSDSYVVEQLTRAGGVIIGKANLHEFVSGPTTQNPPPFGPCRNPWDLARIPGGSSGGSAAALAADMCLGALGSDTGGSIRMPSALNGVAGLRPTYGRVSNRGTFAISWSLDTVGPMARRVDDAKSIFDAIEGFDPDDPRAVERPSSRKPSRSGLDGLRIGMPARFFFEDLNPDVDRAVRAAVDVLADLGATVHEVDMWWSREMADTASRIVRAEALAIHRDRFDSQPELFAEDFRRRLELGESVKGWQLAASWQRMYEWGREVARIFDSVDVVISPTTKIPAPKVENAESIETTWNLGCLTYPWSYARMPALSVPCGISADGLPIGMQIAGPAWADELVLAVGSGFQAATDWHLRRPRIPTGSSHTAASS